MSDDRPSVHGGQNSDFTFALPASFGQERLWYMSTVDRGANLAYQMLGAVRVIGELDVDRLERALRAVIARHEVLRTTFRHQNGELTQVVRPRLDFHLTRLDVSSGCAGRAEDGLAGVLAAEATTPFDLAHGPLVRGTVVATAPGVHTLVVALHHTICDGWSLAVLFREITACYRALGSGRPVELPPLPIQYGDYAVWQRNRLESGELAAQTDYWRRTLDGLEPLPFTGGADFAADHRHHRLDPAVVAELLALARKEGTTPHAALTAAVTSVLRAFTGVTDLAVGTAVAGRGHLDLEQLVGFFVNTVAIRTDHSDDPTFRRLLRRVGDTCLDAFANQDVPFERLVAQLRPRRSAPNPFFSVMVTLQNQPPAELDVPGLRFTPLPTAARFSPFPLDFVFRQRDGHLTCDLDHHTAVLGAAEVDELWAAFETLLAAAVAEPDRPLSALLPTTATPRTVAAPAKVRLVEEPDGDTVVVLREDVPGEVYRVVYTTGGGSPEDAQVLDELPRTPTGDVDLHALPAPYVAPRTELERTIAAQWHALLRERVGVHDDFFDLGGHSLLAVRATNELSATLGVELPVNVVLEHPTVARLAGHLESTDHTPATGITKLPRVLTH